jgi:hypothetical protein
MSGDENGFDSAADNAVVNRGWDEVLADAIRVLTEAAAAAPGSPAGREWRVGARPPADRTG